ncbi:L,D-transpeptidase [Pseudonocardia sp. KRD291]|uniref:L,D-transpeptidase n=1 Tax=Pseudonocardia sp. KRD291 TaxID=2792007 RepID=UPI001C49DF85|nr:L,D-transpeptidase [Pseudonocardia sp. KRD291]MBW0101206.1 L,D-transpeptidase [Pseudonocardia sp. KRD291]
MSSSQQAGTRRTRRVVAGVLSLVAAAGVALAGSAAADSPAAEKNRAEPLVADTPCTATAKACVDLDSQRSWLFQDGKIIRGPIKISSGGNGQETPIGHSLRVYRKEAGHKSQESRLPDGAPAPMPWSVFFQDGGIAFHSGDPARSSAGCIHVPDGDAKAYFDYLQIGDQVQVLRIGEEKAARGLK